MTEHFRLAIIGSGPAGLSAAVTAAECGVSHVLLERTSHLSDTIYKYQKRKPVMAHPMRLPCLGNLPFADYLREQILKSLQEEAKKSGANVPENVELTREDVLNAWAAVAARATVNVRFNSEVTAITGNGGAFSIMLKDRDTITAEVIILAIGLQGNLRRLPVPGADRDWVQYQLDDPDAYRNERIIVVGAGDAGIENALALSGHNEVSVINRQTDFSRAKPGNAAAIERAIRSGQIRCYAGSSPSRVEDDGLVIDAPEGQSKVPCDRIIARLGADPPREFLKACGISFPSDDPAAVPELLETYESKSVPGIYLVGALAGYTLIKHAINQGHEVVRRLAGERVDPADEALLRECFASAFPGAAVNEVLTYLRERVPVLSKLAMLQLREAMLESTVKRFDSGEIVFRRDDYTNSLWNIAEGAVDVVFNKDLRKSDIRIDAGEFFGEMGLISGRRRSATVIAATPSVMVETPRRSMRRLQSSVTAIKQELDRVDIRRRIHTALARDRPIGEIENVIAAAELKRYKAFETIIAEDEPVDALYILRTGSATVSRVENGREIVLSYIEAGSLFGERGLLEEKARRAATVRAAIACEVVRIDAAAVRESMERLPDLRAIFAAAVQSQMDQTVRGALARAGRAAGRAEDVEVVSFLVKQGVGEATNAFIIDESLCIGCDNCEKACAATHDGISRVKREAGASAVSVLLPVACRHCENPHCMSDCPVDAITRAPSGEVFINQNTCIGCGNCANNCPYGVISMVDPLSGRKPGSNWLTRLIESVGLPAPRPDGKDHDHPHDKKAVKCDLCKDTGGSPACVSACPTGAAVRISPEAYLRWLRDGRAPS